MKLLTSLIPFLLFGSIAVNSFKPNVKDTLDTTGSIFYDQNEDEVKSYYETINGTTGGDTALEKLQSLLKTNQIKVNYSSGHSKNSTNWSGYYLYERDYTLSPLESSELTGNYKKTGIWINSLYVPYSIYIEKSINSGTYKYLDSEGNEHSGTFSGSKVQFDREHVFPKSFGFNGTTNKERYKELTTGCDAHNLHIGEHYGNSNGHSNYPYGNVANKSTAQAITDGITGNVCGYLGKNTNNIDVFEPLDKDKGDIARTIFYMAARYHTYETSFLNETDETPSLALADQDSALITRKTIDPVGTKDNPANYGILSDLLKRNKEDPVTDFEIHRNNLIYNSVQKNRNPFVDYPGWADLCFGANKNSQLSTSSPKLIGMTSNEPASETSPLDENQTADTENEKDTNQPNEATKTETNEIKSLKDINPIILIVAGIVILFVIILIIILLSKSKRKKALKKTKKFANKLVKNTSANSKNKKKK